MGKEKGGFLTPKAISNRIKSKGLQKLRWFCQMCMKQCRDENGFKCHLSSESHQRQLLLFAENPDKYIDSFSQEFLDEYLELLRRRFGTKRVHANQVYQEHISDKVHTHMNSTQWETLTDFVKWLGKEGHCVVDETEKGWFIQYIDRDPEAIRRQESLQKKEKMEMDDQERTARFIEQQIERAAAQSSHGAKETEATELQRESEEEKVTFNLGAKKAETPSTSKLTPGPNPFKAPLPKGAIPKTKPSEAPTGQKRKSALDDIMEMEAKKKEKISRKDYWLCTDIMVKVVTKKLGEKYYKKKGVVKEVVDKYAAIVKLADLGVKIKVDQEHLETVIPGIGKPVMILNGTHRRQMAVLQAIDEERFSCTVKLTSGPSKGQVVAGIQYEDLSKLYVDS